MKRIQRNLRLAPCCLCGLVLLGLVPGAALPGEPADRAALLAFVAEPLRLGAFTFSGDRFPAVHFEHPERVEKLVGPCTLTTTWYDAHGNTVTAPHKEPGRYAAVVEVRRPGRVSKRFFTLYHVSGNGKGSARATGATLTLPRGTAIDPETLRGQSEDIDELTTRAVASALRQEPAGAALVAGLHDLDQLRRAGKAEPDDRASHRERQWWVDFRRKYYGYDQQYPRPYLSPHPIEGEPAPVVRPGSAAEAGLHTDAVKSIDAACETWVRENGVGFGLCVVRKGILIVNKGYGQYEGRPVTAETPSILASLTKFLNALLLLGFADQGLIDLDAPVEKYVPALRGIKVARSMTVRDLYLHTAGFSGHEGDTWPDLEEVVADLYPALEVGVRHQYQGMGHALASKIMENISGEALPYLYRNHLFRPLGCTQTRADLSSFGSWGTPLELARIGQMALNGGAYGDKRFFRPRTLAQILLPPGKERIGEDKSIRWGVGIKQMDSEGLSPRAFGHSGATGSFLVIDPEHDLVIACCRMSEGNSYQEFLRQKSRTLAAIVATIDKSQ